MDGDKAKGKRWSGWEERKTQLLGQLHNLTGKGFKGFSHFAKLGAQLEKTVKKT